MARGVRISKAAIDLNDTPTTAVELRWEGGLRFTSSDEYGHTLTVDAPLEDGDAFEGFKPGELLLTSLAGCSGIDVVSILKKQRQEVTGLEIMVRGTQQADPPWTWQELHLEYVVKGRGLTMSAVKRAIQLSESKYCSVAATLAGRAKISSSVRIVEEGQAGTEGDD